MTNKKFVFSLVFDTSEVNDEFAEELQKLSADEAKKNLTEALVALLFEFWGDENCVKLIRFEEEY